MKRTFITIVLGLAVMLSLPVANTSAEQVIESRIGTEYHNIRIVQIVDGLEHPWAIDFLPDGRFIVTERPGRLNIIENGQKTQITNLPEIVNISQGGLLDVAIHPDYEQNGWIYISYSSGSSDETATTVSRGRIKGNRFVDVEQIFIQNRHSSPGRHYGSRLAFTEDNKLLISIGDRGVEPERAQDLNDHAGSILRVNDDGSIPLDNPFVDDPNALDEIYSYGNRNIQGLTVHPETGQIWASEHGPRGGDQLNLILPGANYGWPDVTTGQEYGTEQPFGQARSAPSVEDPVVDWHITIAPSGLAIVKGEHFPNWRGNFLAGGLASQQIRRIVMRNNTAVHQEELLREVLGRIRDVRVADDGYIYVINDHSEAGLFRIEPAD